MAFEISISSFDIFDLSLARQRLKYALDAGTLSSSEVGMALSIIDQMIQELENGPTELRRPR